MLSYPKWNIPCSRLQAAISIGLPSDRAHIADGLLLMEYTKEQGYLHAAVSIELHISMQSLHRRWNALDGIDTENNSCCHGWNGHLQTYCSFYNNIRPFCNNIQLLDNVICCHYCSFCVINLFLFFEESFLEIPDKPSSEYLVLSK